MTTQCASTIIMAPDMPPFTGSTNDAAPAMAVELERMNSEIRRLVFLNAKLTQENMEQGKQLTALRELCGFD